MKNFFTLIRPVNLLIMAGTMYCVRFFLNIYESYFKVDVLTSTSEKWDFALLVISTVFIAAAGNAINDYFDVKADRVNRPERLIVGKKIKRRWVIVSHWMLNGLAFILAIVLSIRNETFWYVFIHLISINSLWFYSLYLKKKAPIGNFVIAGLTALVPILCGVHFYVQNSLVWTISESSTAYEYWLSRLIEDGHFIWLLAFFAFTNNFAREIIKDIEDVEGDQLINAKTLPIRFGQRISKLWVGVFLILPTLFFTSLFWYHQSRNGYSVNEQLPIFLPLIISVLLNLLTIVLLYKARDNRQFKLTDNLVKVSMVVGLLTPIYWYFFY